MLQPTQKELEPNQPCSVLYETKLVTSKVIHLKNNLRLACKIRDDATFEQTPASMFGHGFTTMKNLTPFTISEYNSHRCISLT